MASTRYLEIKLNTPGQVSFFKEITFFNGRNQKKIRIEDQKLLDLINSYDESIFEEYGDKIYRVYDRKFINDILLSKQVSRQNKYTGKYIVSSAVIMALGIGIVSSTIALNYVGAVEDPIYNTIFEEQVTMPEYDVDSFTDDNSQEKSSVSKNDYPVYAYSSDINSTSEKLVYSKDNYIEIVQKYAKSYGIDESLILAMISQENTYNLRNDSTIGARGVMQVESIWWGQNITAYNFDINTYETVMIDGNKLYDPNYSIQIGVMILRSYYDILYKKFVPEKITAEECVSASLVAYNMGITSAISLINEYGNEFLNYRTTIKWGDKQYNEHVLSFLNDGDVITFKTTDNSDVCVLLDNLKDDSYIK